MHTELGSLLQLHVTLHVTLFLTCLKDSSCSRYCPDQTVGTSVGQEYASLDSAKDIEVARRLESLVDQVSAAAYNCDLGLF